MKCPVFSLAGFGFPPALVPVLIACLSAGAAAQTDPLVAKGLGPLVSDGTYVWAFADSGTSYSRIDLFAEPPAITTKTGLLPGVDGGLGRVRSALLTFHYPRQDSVWAAGLLALDRRDAIIADTLWFQNKGVQGEANQIKSLTALALGKDTAFIAAGRAGVARVALKAEDQGLVDDDEARFEAFVRGKDSLLPALECGFRGAKKECAVSALAEFVEKNGDPEPVWSLALDSVAPDTVNLWMGTSHGLWKQALGSNQVTQVAFPGVAPDAELKIVRLVADSRTGRIWAFSTGRYALSLDHGRTFQVPPDQPERTSPAILQGFNAAPEALITGDTTWVNFQLDRPGLVLFSGDSVLRNEVGEDEAKELSDILLDAADDLALIPGVDKLTQLAAVASGSRRLVVAGTATKGLFYLPLSGGSRDWVNINRQKALKGGLEEIITYPTLFTAARVGGQPEYVNFGYRLKKDAKVTITVYNYAMEKVRQVVKNAPRLGGARSENPQTDRWDGLDDQGRAVSVGTYYVRVESSRGEGGWGKVLAVAGRK